MKLVNAKYNIVLDLKENISNVLIIENRRAFTDIVEDLYIQGNAETGNFMLSEDGKMLKFRDIVETILNPISLEINSKKVLNRLYTHLQNVANDYFEEKEKLNGLWISLLDQIILQSCYDNLEMDLNIDWPALFKLYNVKVQTQYDSLLEKLSEYVHVLSTLSSKRVLVFINLKSYLDKTELEMLYQSAFYNKIYLVLIEANEHYKIDNEYISILDSDLCWIEKGLS